MATTRRAILNQLKDDLKNNLTAANGYQNEPVEIIRGTPDPTKFIEYPVIGFMDDEDNVDTEYQGTDKRIRNLNITFYGVEEVSYDDLDNFDKLIEDVENFLMNESHWTYKKTTTLGNLAKFHGGVNDNQAYFILEFEIKYDQST